MSEYSMIELVEETMISPRTIRRYIQLGLVPRPIFRGRATRYGRVHLARVRGAADLLRHLGVEQVRARLATMSLQEMELQFTPLERLREREAEMLAWERELESDDAPAWELEELARARAEDLGRAEVPSESTVDVPVAAERWVVTSLAPGLAIVISDNASLVARRVAHRIAEYYAPELAAVRAGSPSSSPP